MAYALDAGSCRHSFDPTTPPAAELALNASRLLVVGSGPVQCNFHQPACFLLLVKPRPHVYAGGITRQLADAAVSRGQAQRAQRAVGLGAAAGRAARIQRPRHHTLVQSSPPALLFNRALLSLLSGARLLRPQAKLRDRAQPPPWRLCKRMCMRETRWWRMPEARCRLRRCRWAPGSAELLHGKAWHSRAQHAPRRATMQPHVLLRWPHCTTHMQHQTL